MFVGGIGPDQHRPGQGHRHHREHDGEKEAQPDGIGGVAPHLAVVLRAEGPRDGDGEAAGDAVDEAQHQIVQAAHAAHRRQRIHANKAADNDGIGQVVKLLEQAAQHQRHRKGKDQLERAALCHVFCHTKPLPGRSLNISLPDLYRQKRPAGRGAGRFAFHEWYYTQLIVILQGVFLRFLRTTLLFFYRWFLVIVRSGAARPSCRAPSQPTLSAFIIVHPCRVRRCGVIKEIPRKIVMEPYPFVWFPICGVIKGIPPSMTPDPCLQDWFPI